MTHHIKTIIREYIEKNKNKQNQLQKVKKVLEENLDKETLNQTQAKITEKSQLLFSLKSSGAAYQFQLQKEKITKETQKKVPGITEVKIKVE